MLNDQVDDVDEMTQEMVSNFYTNLHKKVYGKEIDIQAKDKFWNTLKKKDLISKDGTVTRESLINVVVEEWKGLTP